MVHRIKCDGKIFHVPGGYLRAVLTAYGSAKSIDYSGMKRKLKEEKLPDSDFKLPAHVMENLGYLDFDTMEARKSMNLPATRNYMVVIGIQRNFGRISIVEEKRG